MPSALQAIYDPSPNPITAQQDLTDALARDFGIEVASHQVNLDRMLGGAPEEKHAELVRLIGASRARVFDRSVLLYLAALACHSPGGTTIH